MSVTTSQNEIQRLDGQSNQSMDTLMGNRGIGFTWRRNPAWPELAKPTASEQKVVGLYAVFNDGSNIGSFFAVNCAGAYTVDFGDGSTPVNTASGVQTDYRYSFNASGLFDPIVTFTDAGDLVNRTDHGHSDGDEVRFYRIQSTTGITEGQVYYTINVTKDNFQISDTIGGSPIALTTDGSASLLPYKIAVVTITPQAGQNLTTVNFNVRHAQLRLSASMAPGWLEIFVSSQNLTDLTVGSVTTNVRLHQLENFELIRGGSISANTPSFRDLLSLRRCVIGPVTSMNVNAGGASMFSGCRSLTDVYFDPSFRLAGTVEMFSECNSLVTAPMIYFRASPTVDASGLFQNCRRLKYVPLFDTSTVNNMSSFFQNCSSLETVPLFNTASVSNMTNMFLGCGMLKSVPLFNTASVTNMTSMLQSCDNLRWVPLFNTASVTNMSSMFNGCRRLEVVPLFNTANVTNMSSMFSTCGTLKSVPLFNTVKVTDFSTMFSNCLSLLTVPAFNFGAASINANGMFQGCGALAEVPAINANNVSSGSNFSNIFSSCPSLRRVRMSNMRFTISFASCQLSGPALNEIYTNLPTVTAQTITVSNNWGNDADDPTIATAKGWTVTGS